MKIFLSTFLLLVTLSSIKGLARDENEDFQDYLKETLDSSKYDKRIMPAEISDPRSRVDVSASMYILDISRVDDEKQEFEAQFYFRQSWFDPRLKFSVGKFEKAILRDADQIWTPDLFFVNEKVGTLNKVVHPNIFCRIHPDGKVLLSVRITEKLSCAMNLRKFPHDTQDCEIKAESYGFTSSKMILRWKEEDAVGISPNITEESFSVLEVKPEALLSEFKSGNYSALIVHLKFQRSLGYFARKLYVPFEILVMLSWLPFWIRAKERYLRLTLLLVVFYWTVTIASEVESSIPKTTYTKASDVWIGLCEAMVFAAFLEFIVSCIVANEAEEKRNKRKGEIISSLDLEGKQENTLKEDNTKSTLNKFLTMFEARTAGKGVYDLSTRINRMSRIVFPLVFILFNVVYWFVCCLS